MDSQTDAPRATLPHPYGPRVLVTTEGLEEKPALYIPEGAVSRLGLERGIVLEVGESPEWPTPPFGPGCVVQFHPGHGVEAAGARNMKLINFDCIVAWEDA